MEWFLPQSSSTRRKRKVGLSKHGLHESPTWPVSWPLVRLAITMRPLRASVSGLT